MLQNARFDLKIVGKVLPVKTLLSLWTDLLLKFTINLSLENVAFCEDFYLTSWFLIKNTTKMFFAQFFDI